MRTRLSRDERLWQLFADWCASHDLEALPTTAEVIADFLNELPAPIETQGRRVRAIRRRHAVADLPLELPSVALPTLVREGPEWSPLPRALAQIGVYQHPKNYAAALRGRRDAWILVLAAVVGLTRRQICEIDQSSVALFPQLTIRGISIPKIEPAAECPSCAVTRWLRVAGESPLRSPTETKQLVSPDGVDESTHDCATGLDGLWRMAQTLVPAIDPHGGVSRDAISSRAVSTIMVERQSLGEIAEIQRRSNTISTGRFASSTMDELASAYDDVDERVATLLLQVKSILGETDEMLDHIKTLSS